MIGLWGAIKQIYEARNKEQEKQQKSSSSGASSISMPSGVSSMLSQARSMSSGSYHLP
jgi:hypothetical protein